MLEVAHLEQERGGPAQRVVPLGRGGQAGLVADVDAAAGPAADESLVPEGTDRRGHRHARDAEEPR